MLQSISQDSVHLSDIKVERVTATILQQYTHQLLTHTQTTLGDYRIDYGTVGNIALEAIPH